MNYETIIMRRVTINNIVVESKSFKVLDKWFNCLYFKFEKEKYPYFNYPVNGDYDYWESSFANLPMHGGITFYNEVKESMHNDKIICIIGCDYQHHGDEYNYMTDDNGEMILKCDAERVVEAFLKLHKELANAKINEDV